MADVIAPTLDSCRALGHKLRARSGATVPCHRCEMEYKRATCTHEGVMPNWAGILGWRYHCTRCSALVMPSADGRGWRRPVGPEETE